MGLLLQLYPEVLILWTIVGKSHNAILSHLPKKKIDAYDTDALKFLQMDGSQQQH
jgi:hypothetical protein